MTSGYKAIIQISKIIRKPES